MQKETRFSAPLALGKAKDGTGNEPYGVVPVLRRVSVSADGAYSLVVPGGHITRVFVNVEAAYTTTAQTTLRIGTLADVDKYGTINVSAVAHRPVVSVSGLALLNIAEGSTLVVDVTTVGNVGDGQASVYFEIFPLENDKN